MGRRTRKLKKGILGSVAVDSQTGMETYGQPKRMDSGFGDSANQVSSGENISSSGDALRDNFNTPNYGKDMSVEVPDNNYAKVPEEYLKLFEHDPSEAIIEQATRHPFMTWLIFGAAFIGASIIIIFIILFATDSSLVDSLGIDRGAVLGFGSVFALFALLAIGIVSYIASYVYQKSRMILTNQKLVQIKYNSIISRQVSQLNIGEVEDVNVSQPTLLDRIFKTGTITVETAGEQNNYVLQHVENPYEFARKTIQMHEGAIAEYGN